MEAYVEGNIPSHIAGNSYADEVKFVIKPSEVITEWKVCAYLDEAGALAGSAEDAAIQKFGEGEYIDESGLTIPYTLENLKQDFPESWQKLQKATNVIRNKYDTYLEEIVGFNGTSASKLLQDYRETFLNIDKLILDELSDLFFGLW